MLTHPLLLGIAEGFRGEKPLNRMPSSSGWDIQHLRLDLRWSDTSEKSDMQKAAFCLEFLPDLDDQHYGENFTST